MKMLFFVALATTALLSSAGAKTPMFVVAKPVADKPAITRDPSLGYVLMRSEAPLPLRLIKYPSVEDSAAYARMKTDALAKERKRYPSMLADYQSELATYKTIKKSNSSVKEPVKPVEPTDDNFVFTPFNLMAGTSIGPANRFSKGKEGKSIYLQSLTPGTYRIYGLVSVMPDAVMGTCYCLGSVKFTVKAGEITDLGTVKPGAGIRPVRSTDEIDPRLKDWPIHAADYRAVGKLPNYFGIMIDRIPPIKGVIEYDRDQIVDLRDDFAAVGS